MAVTATRGRVRIEQGSKRVRVYLGGELVGDSTKMLLVWEKPFYPTYYFPVEDVRTDLLSPSGEIHHSPSRGDAEIYTVKAGGDKAVDTARWYKESKIEGLAGHITFSWRSMGAWFEENEQVYVHPRDPYTRIDALPSGRRVEVTIDGVKVADSTNGIFLFETGLPTRYYLPKTDVLMDLLEDSDLNTDCPYKGTASYYHVTIEGEHHENIVWWYPSPVAESARIVGYVSFYNEKVDISIDGVPEGRPKTVFS